MVRTSAHQRPAICFSVSSRGTRDQSSTNVRVLIGSGVSLVLSKMPMCQINSGSFRVNSLGSPSRSGWFSAFGYVRMLRS